MQTNKLITYSSQIQKVLKFVVQCYISICSFIHHIHTPLPNRLIVLLLIHSFSLQFLMM